MRFVCWYHLSSFFSYMFLVFSGFEGGGEERGAEGGRV